MDYEQKLFMEWSRPTLAWSFGMEFDNALISKIDLVPKIGWMSMKANLPISASLEDSKTTTRSFVMTKSLSLGIELGIEHHHDLVLIRLWGLRWRWIF